MKVKMFAIRNRHFPKLKVSQSIELPNHKEGAFAGRGMLRGLKKY
jgi:hypothetical protein